MMKERETTIQKQSFLRNTEPNVSMEVLPLFSLQSSLKHNQEQILSRFPTSPHHTNKFVTLHAVYDLGMNISRCDIILDCALRILPLTRTHNIKHVPLYQRFYDASH
jgi:hypothetical protein